MDTAEELFKQGMKYNLASGQTYHPAVARGFFQKAAGMNHPDATRCFALMLYEGSGGAKDFKTAVKLLGKGYLKYRDREAWNCLIDMLEEEIDRQDSIFNKADLKMLLQQLALLDKTSTDVRKNLGVLVNTNL